MSFAKNIGKNLSNKYGQKPLDSAKNLQRMQQKLLQREQFLQQNIHIINRILSDGRIISSLIKFIYFLGN